ncbi:MAG: MBL fold metallo-hydrolase [Deltaproteobacteria bacterium]|nr:MBL fold metallo-hydrolase [Deltaproteobacteria bacterium]
MAEVAFGKKAVLKLIVGPLEVNCYIVWDGHTGEAFIIDPGAEPERIILAVRKKELRVRYIVNTHGHFDHVGANAEIKEAFGAPVAAHAKDNGLLASSHEQSAFFGVVSKPQPLPDIALEDGMRLEAGGISLEVLHTPGHTEGGVSLYCKNYGLVFTGDTLFRGSVGRTDFEEGSFERLMESIKTKLLPLGDRVRVLPGHGPETTIGEEKNTNPFASEFV